MRVLIAILIIIGLFAFNFAPKTKVDTIVYNGTVYTVNQKFTTAQAFAISDGKIIEVGSTNDILKKYTAKEMVDAQRQAVYPGFIDAHAHFVGYGQSLFQVDLFGANSWEEILERLKVFAAQHPNETWIRGRGWDQNKFPGKAFPTNEKLNELFPDKPVLLTRVDGHAAIANKKALDNAGVKPGQTLVDGEVEIKNGKLTGILVDNATDLVSSKMPSVTKEDYIKWLTSAEKNCFAVGLTTITDCGLMYQEAEGIDLMQKAGMLNIRLYVMLSDDPANFSRYLKKGPYKTDKLFINGFKFYADGALGSRGACLLQPYSDRAGWHGFLLSNKNHYDSMAKILAATNFQMCTHAIGDSANREILNVYKSALKGKNDKRWRIEHAQVINQNDFNLFGSANIVPSVQPTHGTSDMYWASERLGPQRVKGAYAFKQLLQQNGWIPLGTDFPVEDISPFKTFLASVVRKDAKGFPSNGFQKENALTREETIRGMTIWAAKAGFLEKEVGSIEVGKKADFIILDKDLMKISENDILKTKVVMTYVGGKKVYGK
ncbi:MAG TPA: amidohydrolase [Chitinophagaceae bacterium]|nr:amidohydrolase [Chitinophagaceae bacterium]